MNELFPKNIMEHFKRPRNIGEIKNPDGVGKVGNFVCGDIIWLYVKIKKGKNDKEPKITDVKFQTLGCTEILHQLFWVLYHFYLSLF